uniref:Uncharacterized protein n=1 Tax=uncultured Bacillota bacterium TaxID=344338 RepID=A0A650ENT3_9FIRM|nr:hypothetical protein Firmicute1046_0670 [uncultured Firmicutes bacterium]
MNNHSQTLYEGTGLNIIEELYYGNVKPYKECFDHESEYARFLSIISDNEEKLNTYFINHSNTEDESHWFSTLTDAYSEIVDFYSKDRFVKGFQLGAKFMLDTFILPQQSVINDLV